MTESSLTEIFKIIPGPVPSVALQPSRRSFLKLTGSGLVLGLAAVPVSGALPLGAARAASPAGYADAFVRIAPDNTVTVIIKHLDKGQGAATGLATLVAEELDASWSQIGRASCRERVYSSV